MVRVTVASEPLVKTMLEEPAPTGVSVTTLEALDKQFRDKLGSEMLKIMQKNRENEKLKKELE